MHEVVLSEGKNQGGPGEAWGGSGRRRTRRGLDEPTLREYDGPAPRKSAHGLNLLEIVSALGFRFQVFCFLVFGFWFLVSGFWFWVFGFRQQVAGFWFQVSDFRASRDCKSYLGRSRKRRGRGREEASKKAKCQKG